MQRVIVNPAIAHTGSMGLTKSGLAVLEVLVLAHITLVVFQIPLRGLAFDTTFYRDILLITSVGVWALKMLQDRSERKNRKLNGLDWLVTLYLCYGLVTVLVALINKVTPLNALTQFRNTFLPAALYFVAKEAFERAEAQSRLVNLLIIITLVLVLDVICEYVVLRAGYRSTIIPWYPYIFKTDYRFIGNEVFAKGYILPENTPVLGVLGYPHYTVATLMALFAFSYPFFINRAKEEIHKGLWLFQRISPRLRMAIAPLTILAVFVLGVKTHLVSILFILLVLPFFTHRKVLLRNLFLLFMGAAVLFIAGFLEPAYIDGLKEAFLGSGDRDSTFSFIISLNEIKFIANSPILNLVFGNADASSSVFGEIGAFELRLLFFTAAYGLIWLILFLGTYVVGALYARRIIFATAAQPWARLFATGTIGVLAVYLLDMGHYARTMWAPNIDIWIIILGTISVMTRHLQTEKSKRLPIGVRR